MCFYNITTASQDSTDRQDKSLASTSTVPFCASSFSSAKPPIMGDRLTLELISSEQKKESSLMPAVKEDLGRMKTQPRPTICKISTGSGSFAHGITSLNIDQPRIILPTSLRVIAFHKADDM